MGVWHDGHGRLATGIPCETQGDEIGAAALDQLRAAAGVRDDDQESVLAGDGDGQQVARRCRS